jgi:tetratricopeptide (TPR) repeat protein
LTGGSRFAVAVAGAIIVVATTAAYINSLHGVMVFDDAGSILDNSTIRRLGDIGSVLSPPATGTTVTGRPLLNLSLAINYASGGLDVRGYHAVNILIHVLAALALFGIARRTIHSDGRATLTLSFVIALIWAVHPLQTESVTYIVQRAESLAGLFYLLTLYLFIRSSEQSPGRALGFQFLSVGACVLGDATKEILVTAPVIVLLYDRSFLAGSFKAALRLRRGYYICLALTWAVLGVLALHTGDRGATAGADASHRIGYWLTQFHAVAHYLRLAFWPAPLVLDYGTGLAPSVASVLPSMLLVTGLAACTLLALLRPGQPGSARRALGFCGAAFFAILAPTSIVPVTTQVMAEHRMYLPLAPVVAAVVIGGYSLLRRARGGDPGATRPLFPWLAACLVAAAALGCGSVARNRDYLSELAIWKETDGAWPHNPRVQSDLGLALWHLGDAQGAIAHFREALRLKPDYPYVLVNLGNTLDAVGRRDEALAALWEALRLDPFSAEGHYDLGNILLHMGKPDRAVTAYLEAVRLSPGNPDFQYNLGNALVQAGRPEEAAAAFGRAIALRPDFTYAHANLGLVLAGIGRLPDAIAQYEAALRLRPDLAATHNDLGTALAKSGRLEEARAQFEEAVRLDPGSRLARMNLGHALMMEGRVHEARLQMDAAERANPGP